jgi:ADP-ribose pyrophosphatase YjhB (NUDIX family)
MANVTITVLGDLRYRVKKIKGVNWSSIGRKAFSLGHTLETIAVTGQCVVRMNRTGRVEGRKDIPDSLWKRILASIPIPCVDIIIHRGFNDDVRVLLGYRKIYPYNDCWALPGGRIVKGESLHDTANRQMREIGLRPTGDYKLVGVYPINFKHRSDVSVCLSTRLASRQEPQPTKELVRYTWRRLNDLPARLGSNYRIMLKDFKDKDYRLR